MSKHYYGVSPSAWPSPPETYSFSSLTTVETCPLQWQLKRVTYDPKIKNKSAQSNPSAIEGSLVHNVIEGLFQAMIKAQCPPVGSTGYRTVMKEYNLLNLLKRRMKEIQSKESSRKSLVPFRFKKKLSQLRNEVILNFNREYLAITENTKEENTKTVYYPEVELTHPNLNLKGIIDLVIDHQRQVSVIDYKTGKYKDNHRQQVELYALLWWRCKGEIPQNLRVLYNHRVDQFHTSEQDLKSFEKHLEKRLNMAHKALSKQPAKAKTGEHCRFCDSKVNCETYWSKLKTPKLPALTKAKEYWEGEITLEGVPQTMSFTGKDAKGNRYQFVFDSAFGNYYGPFEAGDQLRITGGQITSEGDAVKLGHYSKVYFYHP